MRGCQLPTCLKKSQSLTPGSNLSQVLVNSSARTARTSTPHMGELARLLACLIDGELLESGLDRSVNPDD